MPDMMGDVGPSTTVPASPAAISDARATASVRAVLFALLPITGGAIETILPNGDVLRFGDSDSQPIRLRIRNYRFAKRVLLNGDIGFAEGWTEGEWETDDLAGLLTLLAENIERFKRVFQGSGVGRLLNTIHHMFRGNTRAGARRNILAHYDLGNRFYEAWLDKTMSYSSARFDQTRDLETAQLAKYRMLAARLDLQPGEHVLEIGCGWGGFAEVAAKEFGARVTGITISDEQFSYARARMQRAGLADRVEIRLQDYRDVQGQFDKIASIEMFEAVGERYWPVFFAKIAETLKPGGRAALQVITISDEFFEDYRRRTDFVQRYVFPGGMLASIGRLRQETTKVGLVWRRAEAFGHFYTETLAEWTRRFRSKCSEISAMGYDERFQRLWMFYLCYCEAGFRTGRTDVFHVELETK